MFAARFMVLAEIGMMRLTAEPDLHPRHHVVSSSPNNNGRRRINIPCVLLLRAVTNEEMSGVSGRKAPR
jgi:hypothetical protein